jgi:hypothetical protein
MATREERIHAKIAAIEVALRQPNIAADIAYYHKELERLQTLLQSLENPEPTPVKTPSEFIEQYQNFADVVRSLQKQVTTPNLPEATRANLLSDIEFCQNWIEQLATEFAVTYPNEIWAVETDPHRLAIRDELYELKDREDSLVQLIELHQLSLERQPNALSKNLLGEHQNELETLRQQQAKLQKVLHP